MNFDKCMQSCYHAQSRCLNFILIPCWGQLRAEYSSYSHCFPSLPKWDSLISNSSSLFCQCLEPGRPRGCLCFWLSLPAWKTFITKWCYYPAFRFFFLLFVRAEMWKAMRTLQLHLGPWRANFFLFSHRNRKSEMARILSKGIFTKKLACVFHPDLDFYHTECQYCLLLYCFLIPSSLCLSP